jgi:putative hemolysin
VRSIGARIEGVEVSENAQEDFEEGLADSLESAEREGVLAEDEREMIHNIVELKKTPASRAMIPRTDMTCADLADGVESAMKAAADSGHTRLAVYERDRDHIIGVLHATDLLQKWSAGERPSDLRAVLRPVRFWPENKPMDELLREMRAEKVSFGVLLDEHGGTAGMVTIEDVLERIVGHLPTTTPETAQPPQHDDAITLFSGNEAEADGDVDIDELNARLELELPNTPEYNSLGGLILHRLGRLGQVGDIVDVGEVKLTVKDADDRRIRRVRLERVPSKSDAEVS